MKRERPGDTGLVPAPVVLVSVGQGAGASMITIAWVGVVDSTPPMISVAVRPSRHSYQLLCATREFVVNVPRSVDVERVDAAGILTGETVDKFAHLGFTPTPASKVAPPLILECPINLECVVRHQLHLGSHDLFIGEVVAAHYDEDILDEHGGLRPVTDVGLAAAGRRYWSLGSALGRLGSAGKAWRREHT